MYDKRLEAIVAAVEQGSFSKAAAHLHLSTPSLAKQIESFEYEHDLTLFIRSHRGVTPTSVGLAISDNARTIMGLSATALDRAHACQVKQERTVRLGVSLMCPARQTLESWPAIHAIDPSIHLELVPIGDVFDRKQGLISNLGKEVDLIQLTWSPVLWEGVCSVLPITEVPLALDVSRTSALATRSQISFEDLEGMQVFSLIHASEPADKLRDQLAAHPRIEIVDVESYTIDVFNECAECGGAIITSGAWSGIHPMLVTVPFEREVMGPCTLLYARKPSESVQRFITAFSQVLEKQKEARPVICTHSTRQA